MFIFASNHKILHLGKQNTSDCHSLNVEFAETCNRSVYGRKTNKIKTGAQTQRICKIATRLNAAFTRHTITADSGSDLRHQGEMQGQ